jgi:hypothetical protein
MNHEISEVISSLHYRPAVSIILPFEPKMGLKTELTHALERAADKVEKELLENYPPDVEVMMMHKLRRIIKNLHFNTFKKSIAIFLSPVFEKVLYLDINVEEKIIIDESFEIRDLVYSKKQVHKYILLQLSSNEYRVFIGNSESFIRIISNTTDHVHVLINDAPERVANFTDNKERKEILLDKFMRQADNALDIILQSYKLPLYVMGTDRVLGHFKKLTKHTGMITGYVPGNYEELTTPELKEILKPFIADWRKVMQKDIMNQLDVAMGKQKLACGMIDVWREATAKKGRLLLVEKNYMYAAEHGSSDEIIYKATEPYNKFSYIKDAVDDVIEKVLENGGDVEFVDEGLLKDHHQIALILFY